MAEPENRLKSIDNEDTVMSRRLWIAASVEFICLVLLLWFGTPAFNYVAAPILLALFLPMLPLPKGNH